MQSDIPNYGVIDNGPNKVSHVSIESGEYTGLIVQYGCVSIEEHEDNCKIIFDYNIISNPNHYVEDHDMITELGRVLTDLMNKTKDSIVTSADLNRA